jgi:hypothetical protein
MSSHQHVPIILTKENAEAELARVNRVVDADVGAARALYGALRPEDFELLLYAIFGADLERERGTTTPLR